MERLEVSGRAALKRSGGVFGAPRGAWRRPGEAAPYCAPMHWRATGGPMRNTGLEHQWHGRGISRLACGRSEPCSRCAGRYVTWRRPGRVHPLRSGQAGRQWATQARGHRASPGTWMRRGVIAVGEGGSCCRPRLAPRPWAPAEPRAGRASHSSEEWLGAVSSCTGRGSACAWEHRHASHSGAVMARQCVRHRGPRYRIVAPREACGGDTWTAARLMSDGGVRGPR